MAEHSEDRIIDRHERRRLVPISDVHILRLERAGDFPQRVKLGASRVGWLLSEVLNWIEQRKSQRREETVPNVGRESRDRLRALNCPGTDTFVIEQKGKTR
jgi:prophage regulatory protein